MPPRDRAGRLRRLGVMFVALALRLAPGVTHLGMAEAASPNHERMMEQTGHCSNPPSGLADHGKPAGKACCSSISIAVAADASAPLQDAPIQSPARVVRISVLLVDYLAEIATPPPRIG